MRRVLASSLAVLVLAATACSPAEEKGRPAASPSSSTPTVEETTAPAPEPEPEEPTTTEDTQPETTTEPAGECENVTVGSAIQTALAELNPMMADPMYAWWDGAADTSAFEPCAPLSSITFGIQGATASSPGQVALYSYGEFLGPAAEGVSTYPIVRRLADDTVEVRWLYPLEGDSNAMPMGLAVSRYRWEPSGPEVVRVGRLPDTLTPTEPESTAVAVDGDPLDEAILAGADPAAGGPAPAGAIEATHVVEAEFGGSGAVFAYEPVGASCQSYDSLDVSCTFDSLLDDSGYGFYGEEYGGQRTWVTTAADYVDRPFHPMEDNRLAREGDEVQQLQDGDVLTYGEHVCSAQGESLTCWSTATGEGFFVGGGSFILF